MFSKLIFLSVSYHGSGHKRDSPETLGFSLNNRLGGTETRVQLQNQLYKFRNMMQYIPELHTHRTYSVFLIIHIGQLFFHLSVFKHPESFEFFKDKCFPVETRTEPCPHFMFFLPPVWSSSLQMLSFLCSKRFLLFRSNLY